MKTIDIHAKEWFDRANGNSYFSATIAIDFGLDTQENHTLPFQYGYGDHYIIMAGQFLTKKGLIKKDDLTALWRYCKENDIILRTAKDVNCLKRDVLAFVC